MPGRTFSSFRIELLRPLQYWYCAGPRAYPSIRRIATPRRSRPPTALSGSPEERRFEVCCLRRDDFAVIPRGREDCGRLESIYRARITPIARGLAREADIERGSLIPSAPARQRPKRGFPVLLR